MYDCHRKEARMESKEEVAKAGQCGSRDFVNAVSLLQSKLIKV